MLALLLALLWPAPCADAGTCWLQWCPAERVEWYQVWSGDLLCATLHGRWVTRRDGSQVYTPPRPVYWPHPGDGCWSPGLSLTYTVRACNSAGCSNYSNPEDFGPQDFRCFDSQHEIPCHPEPSSPMEE